MLCLVVPCGVWCVWCVSTQNVPVCPSKTSPCIPAPRAHVFQHVRVVPALSGKFCSYTRGRFEWTHGVFTVPHRTHTPHHTATHGDRDRERQRKRVKRRQDEREKRRQDERRERREDKTKDEREDERQEKMNERRDEIQEKMKDENPWCR